MRKIIIVIVAAFIVQLLFFYRGVYIPPKLNTFEIDKITVSKALPEKFVDAYEVRSGSVIFDLSHENNFYASELNVLVSRIISRGHSVEYLEEEKLKEKLKYANSFVVIAPNKPFAREEVKLLREFVQKGGRLVFIADPTRSSEINSVATEFGIIFNSDYLYNMEENDGNFRYILVRDFKQSEVTKKLRTVAFYAASSIASPGNEVAFGDENTFSSAREAGTGKQSPIVLVEDKILALGDFTFLTGPYNEFFDNNQLVSNIADFLTGSKRIFYLADFPYFFRKKVDIVADESLLETAIALKNRLGIKAEIKNAENSGDTIIIGFYNSTLPASYLKKAGVVLEDDKLNVKNFGKLDKKGSFLVYLHTEEQRNVMIILSDDKEGISSAVSSLENIDKHSITDTLAFVTYDKTKAKEPEKEKKTNASAEQSL